MARRSGVGVAQAHAAKGRFQRGSLREALARRLGAASLAVLAALPPTATTGAQEPSASATWRVGIEVGPGPAVLGRWDVARGPWILGAGAALGPGRDVVRFRATPHVRLVRSLPSGLTIGGALGIEWAALGRGWNAEESEIQWELAAGWRAPGALDVEAGVRWTDYHVRRSAAFVRMSVPLATSPAPDPLGGTPTDGGGGAADAGETDADASARDAPQDPTTEAPRRLGVPEAAHSGGRLALSARPVERGGSGAALLASNPRGDPDPRDPGGAENVDRLGGGAELWADRGVWRGWARWRSNLHADPSIESRTRAVAGGRFPVSLSFSGGGRWRPADDRHVEVAARLDPHALLWMSHLGEERGARVIAARGDARWGRVRADVDVRDLAPIEGRAVDRLTHHRAHVSAPVWGRLRAGLEHGRLEAAGAVDDRWRARIALVGPVEASMSVGTDLVARAGALLGSDATGVRGWVTYRSRPELLHFDALLSRGWSAPTPGSIPSPGPVWRGGLSATRGALALEVRGFLGEPVWSPAATARVDGGYLDASWADTLSFVRVEGRVRIADWGPERAWWQAVPVARATVEAWRDVGPGRLRVRWTARSAIASARAGIRTSGGSELGLGLDAPLPAPASLGILKLRATLDDMLDHGLPVRPGAPRRGRRLTVVLTWAAAESGHDQGGR